MTERMKDGGNSGESMVRAIVRLIRKAVALPFLLIGFFIFPDDAKRRRVTEAEAELNELPVPECEESTVLFTDLSSYIEKLKQPSDDASAAMMLCNQLKSISETRKMPARLSIIADTQYGSAGVTAESCTASIGVFGNDRWQRLRNLEGIHATAVVPLIDEMIEAMAQEGWVTIDSTARHINTFLTQAALAYDDYVEKHCRRYQTTGVVRLQILYIADVSKSAGKIIGARPSILVRVIGKLHGSAPLEAMQQFCFARADKSLKPVA